MRRYFRDKRIKLTAALLGFAILNSCDSETTIKPVRKDIIDVVFASGSLETSDFYNVNANIDGFIEETYIDEGDGVTKNELLFLISNTVQQANLNTAETNYKDAKRNASSTAPQIIQLKSEIEQATLQLSLDEQNYQRYNNLIATNAVSQIEFDKAKLQYESSKSQLSILRASLTDLENASQVNLKNSSNQLDIQKENTSDYMIKSSIEGNVLELYKEPGELVRRGEALAKIGGGETLIKLFIAEEDINDIALDQALKVALNTYPDELFDATISKIYPAFDTEEQSFIVEAKFINRPDKVFHGTQLQANIIVSKKTNVLVIPNEYLTKDHYVIADGTPTKVAAGIETNLWVEITEGLQEDSELSLPNN